MPNWTIESCRQMPVAKCFFVVTYASAMLAANADVDLASGQEVVVAVPEYRYPRRVRWGVYDPYYAVTSRIYAQAALIRAEGDAAVSFAHARNLNAEAYSKELDNWIKELRVYWDRKTLAERKKLELAHVRQIKKMRYLKRSEMAKQQILGSTGKTIPS